MCDVFHPDHSIIENIGMFGGQFPGHNRHISGGSIMAVGIGQPAAIFKMSVHHPQRHRFFIHQLHKGLLTAGYVLRHRHTCVITRRYRNAFYHGIQRLRLSRRQIDLRPTHGTGIFAGCHLIRQAHFPCFYGFKSKKQRHDLCDTGGTSPLHGIEFIDHLPRGAFHQNHRRGRN